MCSSNNKTWAVIQETELNVLFYCNCDLHVFYTHPHNKTAYVTIMYMNFLLWLYFQSSQSDQIYVLLSITAPYGVSDWNRVLAA
jgi:hypothetical protein